MEILIKILQFLLSLSLLIVLHEMGHFFFARLFKTRVEKFYLFFDPWFSLFKVKKRRYRVWYWLDSARWICENIGNDRRKHGHGSNEATGATL